MASDAGVKNIEQLAQFGKNIKNLGQNMYVSDDAGCSAAYECRLRRMAR